MTTTDLTGTPTVSYNMLDDTHWGEVSAYEDLDYDGFKVTGTSQKDSKNAVFSIYSCSVEVPKYARLRKTWKVDVCSISKKHTSTTCLYTAPTLDSLKAVEVDFTPDYQNQSGSENRVGPALYNGKKDNKIHHFSEKPNFSFCFDNRDGDIDQSKTAYIMLVHVAGSETEETDIREAGLFANHRDPAWEGEQYTYFQYITFLPNGGDGTMEVQEIETKGNLTPNAFVNNGYAFAGWAKAPHGAKAFSDGEKVYASSADRGPRTLYALWTIATYTIHYELDGGAVETANPADYTMNSEDFTLNNPTKEGYTFLGWTGSNGDEPQTEVTIAKGSYGDRSYVANWEFTTRALINAIPSPVEHTESCHEAITAALQSFIGLTEEEKAVLTANELERLQAAETAYALLDGKSMIRFVDKNGNPLRDQVIEIDYPDAPEVEGFTFQYWQVAEEDITGKTIRLQAVYTPNTPTDVENVQSDKVQSTKLIRNGNVYILTDEIVYTINGQKVK